MRKSGIMVCFLAVFSITVFGCANKSEEKQEVMGAEAEKPKWQESPLFESGSYTMIGEEGRLGFIYDNSEVVRFYPGKIQKYMWHFWGEEEELKGDLLVKATQESGSKPITVVEKSSMGGMNNGANAHIPTSMSLPKSGMWKLDAYIDDRLFGTVFVEVYQK